MTSNNYHMDEDWGLFVDIESTDSYYKPVNQVTLIKTVVKTSYYEDDEYDYYTSNQKDMESEHLDIPTNNKNDMIILSTNYFLKKSMFKIGSTTLLTALITYIVFFVL
jgi:hypothetical protein